MRLRTYPEVFSLLNQLSHFNIGSLSEGQILELAAKLNALGYGKVGLCMLPDTRDVLFDLRLDLVRFARKEVDADYIMSGKRTDLIELMRRDLSHNWSQWRELKPLIDINREQVRQTLADEVTE